MLQHLASNTQLKQDGFLRMELIYWCLVSDLRLYKETSSKKGTRKDWETVCVTLADWKLFLRHFRKTTNPQEILLYHYLKEELFPLVEVSLEVQYIDQRSVLICNLCYNEFTVIFFANIILLFGKLKYNLFLKIYHCCQYID